MKTRIDMAHEEATRDPIFLFQVWHGTKKRGHWDTERVFYSREEAREYGNSQVHNFGKDGSGWMVYCIPAEGKLAEVLKAASELDEAENAIKLRDQALRNTLRTAL